MKKVCKYLFIFTLTLSNGVKRDVAENEEHRFLPEFICDAVWSTFAQIYLFLPLIFSIGEKRHVVEYDKLRFQPEILCNVVRRMFANIYLFLPLTLSNCVKRHVVEYDKLRFQPEFICNAYVKMFCKICIYFYRLFSQMVSNDMLLSMMNSDFSQKSFVMLCEECLQISIYIYPLFLSNSVKRDGIECDKLQISARNHL